MLIKRMDAQTGWEIIPDSLEEYNRVLPLIKEIEKIFYSKDNKDINKQDAPTNNCLPGKHDNLIKTSDGGMRCSSCGTVVYNE